MIFWNETDKKTIEKKRIKRVANGIGGAFIVGTFISVAVQIVLMLLGCGDVLNTTAGMWILQIILSAFMFTVPFVMFSPTMNVRISSACPYCKPKKGITLPIILCGLGACMAANVLGSLTSTFFEMLGITDYGNTLTQSTSADGYGILISLLGGAALPALVEEFALRGVVLGSLRRFGDGFAIITSAAMFGIMHGTVSQIPFAFVVGLYLGFAVVKTGSIWTAVIIHFINNACAFVIDIAAQQADTRIKAVINGLYFMVMITLGIIGFAVGKEKNVFSLSKPKKENDGNELVISQKLAAFFSAPVIIIYIAVVVFELLLVQLERLISL